MSTIRLSLLGDCVIHVNDTAVAPSSTHLFALLLVLGLEGERRVHRSELQQLLFAPDIGAKQASHNLRQLLYRVRRLGTELNEATLGLRLPIGTVLSVADQLSEMTSSGCEGLNLRNVAFLPSYSPRLPKPYLEWLDRQRDHVDNMIRDALRSASDKLRASHDWPAAYRVSSTLASVDPDSEAAVAVMAEALTMLGRRNEALTLINSFAGLKNGTAPSSEGLRPLRARIARIGDVRSEGVLRGRNECLASLETEWEKLGPDGARRAVLNGHGGIGKTRVAEAFADRVRLLGAHVTRYTCDVASSEQPLGLFSDILPELRSLRGSLGASPALASALDRLRPAIGHSDLPTPSEISVEAVRAQVKRALIDLLEAVTEDKPLLLLIDDAHYLDEVSAKVIAALCGKPNTALLLIVLCVRPSQSTVPLLEPVRRGLSFILDPLPADVSRQVILDAGGSQIAESHIEWCLAQAAGNPFYLHTLASQRFVDTRLVPFDIRSLAANAYSSLGAAARTVIEACLLLGRLATLSRVTKISGVSEPELLGALRELEELDLIQFSAGVLVGPHALLHDALVRLVPSSVAALLHSRIATTLEVECEVEQYVFPVAWAAAQSWIAAGDPHAAAALIRRCAHHAAIIGELNVATELLSRVVDATLPAALHAELLDDLTTYAEALASPAILASASRTRLKLSKTLGESVQRMREFQRRVIEADIMAGGPSRRAIDPLMVFLSDQSTAPLTRAHAAARLMVIADQDLDAALADSVFGHLSAVTRDAADVNSVCVRAEVVFHTFCGDVAVARDLSRDLLGHYATSSSTQESIRARSFAAFSLQRLHDERASDIFRETYDWMMSHGIYKQALYAAAGLTSIAITRGDFNSAREWIARSKIMLRGEAAHELSPQSGLYCNDAILAIHEGRYDDAEPLIFAPAKDFSFPATARDRSVSLAIWLRLKQLRGDDVTYLSEINQLEALYARGKHLGGQDPVVEALWAKHIIAGDASGASHLLSDYLRSRREKASPEWSLRHTTAADEAWLLS